MLSSGPPVLSLVLAALRPGPVAVIGPQAEAVAGQLAAGPGGWSGDVVAVAPGQPVLAELVLLCGMDRYDDVRATLDTLLVFGGSPPVVLVDGVDGPAARRDAGAPDAHAFRNGVRTAVEDALAAAPDGLEKHDLPGLGGVTLIVPPAAREGSPALVELLDDLALSPALLAHTAAIEAGRLVGADAAAERDAAVAELDMQRARAAALESDVEALRRRVAALAAEHAAAIAQARLVGPPGPEDDDVALARRVDRLSVAAERAPQPPPVASAATLPDGAVVTYLLLGMPDGGSGGTHSVVQEAGGLAALGVRARVAVPGEHLARAHRVYPDTAAEFVAYDDLQDPGPVLAGSDVVVATEGKSVELIARFADGHPAVRPAYYVQDYEPLFAPEGAAPSDMAVLSYRRAAGWLVFAKTRWLAGVVHGTHGVPVHVVAPSLDTTLFSPLGRDDPDGPLRVVAMVRPRTPRRRARATLEMLEALAATLGDAVSCAAFGCDPAEVAFPDAVRPLGVLSRPAVAATMRRSDVFADLSVYQAFGRAGLEAMACGAVPLLPQRGGAATFATDGRDALLVDTLDVAAVVTAIAGLAEDRARLAGLRAAGAASVQRFSVDAAARSQAAVFAAALAQR